MEYTEKTSNSFNINLMSEERRKSLTEEEKTSLSQELILTPDVGDGDLVFDGLAIENSSNVLSSGIVYNIFNNINSEIAFDYIFIRKPPLKLTYNVGDYFDKTGMEIYASYGNIVAENISLLECTFSPSRPLTTADKQIIIYWNNKPTKKIYLPITVV